MKSIQKTFVYKLWTNVHFIHKFIDFSFIHHSGESIILFYFTIFLFASQKGFEDREILYVLVVRVGCDDELRPAVIKVNSALIKKSLILTIRRLKLNIKIFTTKLIIAPFEKLLCFVVFSIVNQSGELATQTGGRSNHMTARPLHNLLNVRFKSRYSAFAPLDS